MTEIVKTVGDRIRLYRQKSGLSQSELGELAGLHNTYIGQIERGEKNVSLEAIDKIIRALGLPYEVFYAKLNGDNADVHKIAAECYEQIIKMDSDNQLRTLEIIRNIVKMTEK